MQHETAREIDEKLATLSLSERLEFIASTTPKSVFTTSLGIEDQLITHLIAEQKTDIKIVTLQTGRLFPQTLALIAQTKSRYGVEIEEFHPDQNSIEEYKKQYGINGFYDSVQARHKCCQIRKIIPLSRALEARDGWITGLRRGQSGNRDQAPFCEWSPEYNLFKYNPLADLSTERLDQLIEENDIPINELHKRGYPSIGCEPCTRAIKPHEHPRAGRWWWEQEDARECGLHASKSA